MGARRHPLREVLFVYGTVATGVIIATRLEGTGVGDYVGLAVAALFLLPAVRLAQREPGGPERYGLALGGLLSPPSEAPDPRLFGLVDTLKVAWRAAPLALRETAFALGVAVVVFVPFTVGFYYFHGPTRPFQLTFHEAPLSFALAQLIVIALPEEAFFRGYVQTRLTDRWPATRRVLGAQVSIPALLVQAALFGLIHFVDLNPARLAVFFPGLLFGWLRARRGGIGAALVFHALSNLLSDTLQLSWGLG